MLYEVITEYRIGQASGLVNQWYASVAKGYLLGQTARLVTARHQKQVAAGVDAVSQRFIESYNFV